MEKKFYAFIFLCLLSSAACAEKKPGKDEGNVAVGTIESENQSSEQSIFKPVPNTKWQYANLNNLIIHMMLKSENTFSINDEIGERGVGLMLQSQVNIGHGYPSVMFLSKKGPENCSYLEDSDCVISVQYANMRVESFPAKVFNNSVRSEIHIIDDDFLDKLEEFESLIVDVPVSPGVIEKMVFDVRGFKREFLEFSQPE